MPDWDINNVVKLKARTFLMSIPGFVIFPIETFDYVDKILRMHNYFYCRPVFMIISSMNKSNKTKKLPIYGLDWKSENRNEHKERSRLENLHMYNLLTYIVTSMYT